METFYNRHVKRITWRSKLIPSSSASTFRNFILVLSYISVFLLETTHCSNHQHDEEPYSHNLFSRATRVQARVTREEHVNVHGTYRHREKREVPISSTQLPDGDGHVERISVSLKLDGKPHIIDLQLNRDLISQGYFERTQRNNKTVVNRPSYQEVDDCHYHGKVRGQALSWAAISTCDDLVRGTIFDGNQLHYLEPDDDNDNNAAPKETAFSWNLLHLKPEHLNRNLSCGHEDHYHNDVIGSLPNSKYEATSSDFHKDSSVEYVHLNRVKRSYSSHDDTRVPYNSNAKSRYVELVIVVDNKKYKELGADLKAVRRRTKDIVNIVNALYSPLNIFIALIGMIVWTESDEIAIKPNGDETLSSFLHYRKERLLKDHPNDNAQLLTAVEFENGVVGKAMQGPICSFKYSGGVNSDFKNNVIGVVATTVAHELGHNFGLSHDTEACTCPSPNNRCIMAASASSNRTMHWSSCSLKDFAYAFDHGMEYCLRNRPKSLYDGPTCGNGFTEPGEECDCGLPEHCENPCCDASTCLMHLNATCASGTCCDIETCHVKPGGTVCRESTKLCDLPEYCTGESEFCPDDVTKMDGLTCETPSGKAYCYNGECRTHTDQCKLLWGPSGNNSNDLCYQKNDNGSRHAHCGYNLTTEKYAKCDAADVKCGILHCQMNSEKLEFGYESVSILASFFVNAGGKIHPCRSVIVDFGLSDINPGMVPDGAKCGDDKMCVNQKCIPVKSVLGSSAPLCPYDCDGHGVCNSKGHCHCDDGYGGPYCQTSGYGGSIDSGPARDPYGTSKFFKILYVTFLGFIPLIAIITFYIYYAGDYFKKLCFSIITFQAFSENNRSQRNNKPSSNGSTGGGLRTRDISSPTPNHSSSSHQNGSVPQQGQGGEDFFGQFFGFSLSPIKSSPLPQQRSGNGGGNSTGQGGATTLNNNNNDTVVVNNTTASSNLPNGSIQSETNANVYYSTVPKQTETLVGNSERPSGFRLGNPQTSFLQGTSGNRSVTRVSWAQPIASPVPASPGSEDESANSDTPLYENSGAEKSSPKILKLVDQQSTPVVAVHQPGKARPASSPDALEEMKRFYGKSRNSGGEESSNSSSKKEASSGFGGSTSALSRLAAAIPFVRSSFRMSNSTNDDNSKSTTDSGGGGGRKTNKGLSKKINRGNLEISRPILQTDLEAAQQGSTFTRQHQKPNDVVDSCPRYANVPVVHSASAAGEHVKKPALKNTDKVRGSTPPPESTTSKSVAKVQRAHSMIQPSNRNSVLGTSAVNPNYNSLRRARPSVPPPKPPEAPPPPPPTYMQQPPSSFSEAKARFLQNSTATPPPPVPPPNNASQNSNSNSPKGLRSSIAKFSFGSTRSRSSSPSATPPSILGKQSGNNGISPSSVISSLFKAPIAKVDELNSPCSPPGVGHKKENIYDTIDEGMINISTTTPRKPARNTGGSVSGDSSPSPGGSKSTSRRGSEEKIETLSTGSSESNGGLLSEIILEIQTRNKESIYNSVDRRKQRREKKAAAATALLVAEKAAEKTNKPEITPKPASLSSLSKLNSSSGSSIKSFGEKESDSRTSSNSKLSSPNSSRKYVSPLSNHSTFSFYKRPTGPGSTSNSPSTVSANKQETNTSKQKVVLNPTVTQNSTNPSTMSSRPSSSSYLNNSSSSLMNTSVSSLLSKSRRSSSPHESPLTSSTESNKSTNAVNNTVVNSAISSSPASSTSTVNNAKPTCAVNGVPKVNTSPSYVAKINYFSNLGQAANNTPMKPINSIPAPSKENPAKEIIYAPSNVDLRGDDASGGERSHYAATIRRSRPQYYNNKDLESDLNDANSNPVPDNNRSRQSAAGRKPMGIYGSLGRKVATPVIRSNSIEKEKQEARSKESTPDRILSDTGSGSEFDSVAPSSRNGTGSEKSISSSTGVGATPQVGGYKPFNPYLNRPLTFSTFRPNNTSSLKSNNASVPASQITTSNNSTGIAATATLCSVSSKPLGSNGVVAVTSPVQLRSPNRLVK